MAYPDPQTLPLLIDFAGLGLTFLGFFLIYLQIRQLSQSARASAHAAIYSQAADFRAHLIANPELRKYFFDGVSIEPGHPDYDRAVTLAEVFLNYLEHLAVQKSTFAGEERKVWTRFATQAVQASPLLAARISENRAAYSRRLTSILT